MELQIALDRMELDEAVRLTERVAGRADRIEVGTSLVKRYGTRAVSEVVAAGGGTPVLADLKTADDLRTEFALAADGGARAVTVLGQAPEETVRRGVEVAAELGLELLVDLLGVSERRRERLLGMLPEWVLLGAHLGKDAQGTGGSVVDLLGDWVRGRRVAVAGGMTEEVVASLSRSGAASRAIVGSAITKAADPVERASRMREVAGRGPC
ncbi:orotidine 5'-phosphate decarboxylase / HUMPS family protein [Actinopolyspora saharensis]|uniref:orotidine 5'-phosphate decarboxylase / HUMPS family protein n=1 Tax=Actinopolyspora saharensis TaxID=995062 RepID=UPI003F675221